MFKFTTSGVPFSKEDLDRMINTFSGSVKVALSIDIPHDNFSGDVFEKFAETRDNYSDIFDFYVSWTDLPSRRNDKLRNELRDKCDVIGVGLINNPVIDAINHPPRFGLTLNLWEVIQNEGWHSERINNGAFDFCYIPVEIHDSVSNIVQLSYPGVYRPCMFGLDYLKFGEVGDFGVGGLKEGVGKLYDDKSGFVSLIREGGALRVAEKLLETGYRDEIIEILNRKYPLTCGVCYFCDSAQPYLHVLEGIQK